MSSTKSGKAETPIQVKKVKPYPISCGIVKAEGQPVIRCQIVKLTEIGLLLRIGFEHLLRVGDNLQCEFDLPTTDLTIKESVKIIKTYLGMDSSMASSTQAAVPTGVPLEKVSTVEVHFRSIKAENRAAIQTFTKKIGQK